MPIWGGGGGQSKYVGSFLGVKHCWTCLGGGIQYFDYTLPTQKDKDIMVSMATRVKRTQDQPHLL